MNPGQAAGRTIPKRSQGPYLTDRCMEQAPRLLLEGIAQFNRGEFFEQHETLEELWRAEPDDVRYLYQGILQVGVGFYHLRRRNHHGAVSKLESGITKLRWFEPACQGVDVSGLVAHANDCLVFLRHLGPEHLEEFDWGLVPNIRLVVGEAGTTAPTTSPKPGE